VRLALVGLVATLLVSVAAPVRASDTSSVYVRVEAGGTANAATFERTDATEGGRLSSVHAHTFGSTLRAQIGYIVVPRFSLAATIAVDYASISPTDHGYGDALATFGKYTQTSESLEATWIPAGGLRLGGAFGWSTVAFPNGDQDAFVETLDGTLSGPYWGLLLGYDVRMTSFAWLGVAARADFAHVTDTRPDGHSTMTSFAPGISVALMFR
jgi:hypothetical protein